MKEYLGFNNKYGRPTPYVWFIIFAVSSIPLFLSASIDDSMPCTAEYILDDRTTDEFFKQKHFSIDEALLACDNVKITLNLFSKIFSGVIFGLLTWQLKPYPLSKPNEIENKDERKSAI